MVGGWGGGAVRAQAALPFFDGFESGELAACWTATHTATNGRIAVTTNEIPYDGNWHVVLDSSVMSGAYNLNELILEIDLAGQEDVTFECQAKSFFLRGQEIPEQFTGSTNRDGVALSVDRTNWFRLAPLTNVPSMAYTNLTVGLDGFAADRGLNLDGVVWIKFQQYGHSSAIIHGLAFDNVQLYAQSSQADLAVGFEGVPPLLAVGSNLAYAVTVSNAGPDAAAGVVLTNRWSLDSTVVSAAASRGTWTTNADSVVAELGDLAAGECAVLEMELVPLVLGVLTNRAEAAATTLDVQPANNHPTATTAVEPAGGDLSIGPVQAFVDEDGGWVDLTVFRTGGLAGTVSVVYETAAGTAEAGSDYEAAVGTLFLSNGANQAVLRIPILNDDAAETAESFELRLSQPGGGGVLVAPSNAAVHVRDEDGVAGVPFADGFEAGILSNCWSTYTSLAGPPFVSGTNGPHAGLHHVDMGGEAYSNVLCELILSADLAGRENVRLRFWHKRFTWENEAPMPASFAGHVVADGVALSVDGTNWYKIYGLEDAETGNEVYRPFEVDLDAALAAHGLAPVAPVRIKFQKSGYAVQDQYGRFFDDVELFVPAGELRFAEPWEWSVAEGGGTITLAVERIHGTVGEASVQYAAYGATATPGIDFIAVSGTLVFPDGVDRQEIAVPIPQDADDETPEETFTVLLFNPQGGADLVSPLQATVSIADDDGIGEVGWSAAHHVAPENGGWAEIPVWRRYGSAGAGSVDWSLVAGTATPGVDYVEATGTLAFAAGATSAVVAVQLLDDADAEGAETLQLRLHGATGDAVLGARTNAWLSIADDEAPRASCPYYEGFESGVWSNAWATNSTGAGRIQLANPTNGFEGERGLFMDSASGRALNEATLTVDLAGQTGVTFRCWTRDYADGADYMPPTFVGSIEADGIAVSADGLIWHRLVDLTEVGRQSVYTNLEVDLSAFAAQRGLPLTAMFQIRFQQVGNAAYPNGGRSFDHVSLTPAPAATATVVRAQGFEGGREDTWNFRLMPVAGSLAVRSERARTGSRALRLAGSDEQSEGAYVEFDNVAYGGLENARLAVAYGAAGPDNDDDLFVRVSYDDGLTWTTAVQLVDGYGNADVPFGGTSASNPATAPANPWILELPESESQIKVRIWFDEAAVRNNTNDFYYVDDVVLYHVPSNRPPVLDVPNGQTVRIGERVEFAVSATDVDSDAIVLTASNLPAGATFAATNGNGTFTWKVAGPTGVYEVVFAATDKDGSDAESVAIAVIPLPLVIPAPEVLAATGVQSDRFTANWLAVSNATGYRLDVCTDPAFPPSGRGPNLLENGGFETGDVADWDRVETEYAVATNAQPQEGTYHVACAATSTRDLMQAVEIVGDGVSEFEVSFWYRKPSTDGNARMWCTWASGGQVAGDSLQPNTYLPAASHWARMDYVMVPAAGTNILNFEVRTYSGAAAEWDSFFVGAAGDRDLYPGGYHERIVGDATSCEVAGLAGAATYYYRVQAFNAETASVWSVATGVVTAAAIPTPPILQPIGNRSVLVNGFLSFSVIAVPTDGDVVTLTASNLPAGALFDPTNHFFHWIPTSTGVYSVTFYAADKDGTVEETIEIAVVGALLAPVILPAADVRTDRFTACWLPSAYADGYYLDVGTNATFTAEFRSNEWTDVAYHNGTLGQGTGGTWSETGLTQGSSGYLIALGSNSLVSPPMDLTGETDWRLTFKGRTYGGVNTNFNAIAVSISTNGGAGWSLLGMRLPANTTLTALEPFDLGAFRQAGVCLKLEASGASGTVGAGLDD
ncbi:MAG: Calx-beta domain-containing protein, partial [Kiritimatiellia bacterium]